MREHWPETREEYGRRLHGKRAGIPGEGFADVRIVIEEEDGDLFQQVVLLSEKIRTLTDTEDNPEQLLLQCPKCGLMNGFTVKGKQIFHLEKDGKRALQTQKSTTKKRISVRYKDDTPMCTCSNCGMEFTPPEV
ncbi:hypothetical protein COU77_02745 [Candidatus Peregrinibacteria bacterium CG10_big_fil_rev_8_21_14_0_10_49_16]|nr:MAG: hypothetical protein COW95_02255 [Candidatus Peregrinibacteria bacterium CG22_combo_CG10-13_8_21_14_all_49_11]PIR51957.1 MAG: hypothetical protein COU77_02745 [Candidatus Peregrinibacteria bacterium CG10_big_fil_rev_8_21_14_0_10_49_16]